MIRIVSITQLILLLSIFYSCQSEHEKFSTHVPENSQEKEDLEGVSIELSMPYGDSLKWLGICWDKNPVDVIIRNQTDSIIHFYEDWNSWGYYNLSFQIETSDSIYTITRTRNVWWKNFPSYHSINPDESLVFHYDLVDSTCFEYDEKIKKIKGLKQWTGLPQKEYVQAKIRVMYELPDEYQYLANNGFRNLNSYLENESDSLIRKNDTTFIFSNKLISKPLNIEITK